jgi:formylglycine-generating enzyme required for sulfatase activity
MELVDGWTFDEFAAECGSVDGEHPRMLLTAMIKVARAVHAAHEQGIIHRDLKPSNVRVDRRGEPRVLDFGLAKLALADQSAVTATGQWVGSLPWFSPEVANHGQKAADERSDVYALSVVFYQALTGRFPYGVEGPLSDVLKRICHALPQPVHVLGSSLPDRAIDAVMQRALAKAPAERYASAGALADDLEAILRGTRTIASHSIHWRRWRRIAGVLAVLIIAANAVWWFWPRPVDNGFELPHMENRFGMKLITLPAGGFHMGSPEEKRLSRRDETEHEVILSRPFWIGATEVTRGQYAAVMERPSQPATDANLPVINLSRNDAIAFCQKLSRLEGRTYRLPTEADWEYACKTHQAVGLGPYPIEEMAWVTANALGKPHPVATRKPNHWGVFDLLGNAEEWVLDGYAPHTSARAIDPLVPLGEDGKGILKGGYYGTTAARCRPAAREQQPVTTRVPYAGFRVVLEIARPLATQPGP